MGSTYRNLITTQVRYGFHYINFYETVNQYFLKIFPLPTFIHIGRELQKIKAKFHLFP